MNRPLKKFAIPGLRYTLGVVVLLESLRFAFSHSAAHLLARVGLPQWIAPTLGGTEALAAILALRDGFLPPTANYNERDPQCDLDVVPNVSREASVEFALSNSFAFGGLNAVLAMRR